MAASHLEAAAAATAEFIPPTVLDDKRAGAENEPAVDGEATGAHGGSTAAHFQASGFDVQPSSFNGSRSRSLACNKKKKNRDVFFFTLENGGGGEGITGCRAPPWQLLVLRSVVSSEEMLFLSCHLWDHTTTIPSLLGYSSLTALVRHDTSHSGTNRISH